MSSSLERKKNYKQLNIELKNDWFERVANTAKNNGITKQEFIRRLITSYYENNN